MKKLIKKLRSRAGESLVESMAAILIFTLASIIMYTMITAAADINTTAKQVDRTIQEQLVVAERADTATDTGSVTMTMGGKTVLSEQVNIYGGQDGALYSYFAK